MSWQKRIIDTKATTIEVEEDNWKPYLVIQKPREEEKDKDIELVYFFSLHPSMKSPDRNNPPPVDTCQLDFDGLIH